MMRNEESVLEWLDKAIEMVRPYLPDDHEVDDCQWGDGCFQFSVFNCSTMEGSEKPVDRFRFFRCESETDSENEERFFEEVQRYIDSWN